jgi:hypothetical protein
LGLLNRPELNKVLSSLIYSWVEGRGKDIELKSLFILEDCIFLLEFYPSLYILEAVDTFGSHYFP